MDSLRARHRRCDVGERLGRRGVALERTPAREQLEGDDAERVPVARGCGRLSARLLG